MSRVTALEAFVDPLFYETVDRYDVNEDDFLAPVRKMLTGTWTFHRRAVWFGCTPPEGRARDLPGQGWKIHVSCALSNALDILEAIVPVLDAQDVDFKFALDRQILGMMNSKNWGRQAAGKFVTIYPVDEAEFFRLLADLHAVTRAFEGIYILSDRRYKDSKILFYRYGGIRRIAVANARGEQTPMLISPSGEMVPDERRPYFHVPSWARDPFADDLKHEPDYQDEEGRIALKDGRYLVKNVLGYSNSGGVYIADDTETGEEVVIKEARPFVTYTEDSISLAQEGVPHSFPGRGDRRQRSAEADRPVPGLGTLLPGAGVHPRGFSHHVLRDQQRHPADSADARGHGEVLCRLPGDLRAACPDSEDLARARHRLL